MSRVVSLHLSHWPTDRLRRALGAAAPPPEAPVVMVGHDGRRRVVTAACAAARALGLRPGLAAARAQVLVPGLATHPADPAGDLGGLERLAAWALRRYAPTVAADPPDGLVLDVTGAAHLHGGEALLLDDLVSRLGAAGIAARAALAPTWGAAHALARWSGSATVIIGIEGAGGPDPSRDGQARHDRGAGLATVLAPLPVKALRLAPDVVDGLCRLGLDTLGDLLAQPRAPLALRFGPEPGRRIDQALGRLPEPITAVTVPDMVRVARVLAEPVVDAEILARHVGRLAEALAEALEARGLGARRLDLLCQRVDSRVEVVRVGFARPSRDARHLARLIEPRLECVDPGLGVERLTLLVPWAEPLGWRLAASELGAAAEPDVAALLDALGARVGASRLYRLARVESDVPERSVRRVAPLAPPSPGRWPAGWPRPARLLRTPEPVETLALLPDHPPVHFTWRGVRRRVLRADGPERIHGEWARSDAELWMVRDYFAVEDEAGERFWLFRAGDGADPATGPQAWFLHGLFG